MSRRGVDACGFQEVRGRGAFVRVIEGMDSHQKKITEKNAKNSEKTKQKRSLTFRFIDCIPKFHLVSLINFILGLALNPIMVNVLDAFN